MNNNNNNFAPVYSNCNNNYNKDDSDRNLILICPECKVKPPRLVEEYSSGDIVCEGCGLVLSEHIVDERPEWALYDNGEKQISQQDPFPIGNDNSIESEETQLETKIGVLTSCNNYKPNVQDLTKVRLQSNRAFYEEDLKLTYFEIQHMCNIFSLPETVEKLAMRIYKETYQNKVFKYKPREGLMAGTILISCRQLGIPRTFQEISKLAKIPKNQLGQIVFLLSECVTEEVGKKGELIKSSKDSSNIVEIPKTEHLSSDFLLGRFCSYLNLSELIALSAEDISERIKKLEFFQGRSPVTISALSIFIASTLFGETRSMMEITKAVGVSYKTIQNIYEKVWARRYDIIDPEWISSGRVDMMILPYRC